MTTEYVVTQMLFNAPDSRGKKERIAHLIDPEAPKLIQTLKGKLLVTAKPDCRAIDATYVIVEQGFVDKHDFRICKSCTGDFDQSFRTSDEPWYMKGADFAR